MPFDIQQSDIAASLIEWSKSHGLAIVVVIAGALVATRVLRTIIHRAIHSLLKKAYRIRDHIAIGKREETLQGIANSAVGVAVWLAAGLMILSEIGVNIGPLLAGAGIAGIAVGFGGQYFIRDLIAGLVILLEDQYRKGDVVKIGGVAGLVEDVTLRRTILRDLDGVEHHVPNGEISVTSNLTKIWARAHLNIPVAYSTNLEHAIEVLNRIGEEMAKEKQWKDDFLKPVSVVGVDDFADSAIVIKILGDTKPMRQWDVMRELRKRIKIAFDKEGIEIPYPHRVVIKK